MALRLWHSAYITARGILLWTKVSEIAGRELGSRELLDANSGPPTHGGESIEPIWLASTKPPLSIPLYVVVIALASGWLAESFTSTCEGQTFNMTVAAWGTDGELNSAPRTQGAPCAPGTRVSATQQSPGCRMIMMIDVRGHT